LVYPYIFANAAIWPANHHMLSFFFLPGEKIYCKKMLETAHSLRKIADKMEHKKTTSNRYSHQTVAVSMPGVKTVAYPELLLF